MPSQEMVESSRLSGAAGDLQGLSGGPAGSRMGLGLSLPSPRWLLIRDEVTSAVPGAPESPGNWKSGLPRPFPVAGVARDPGLGRLTAEQDRRAEHRPADLGPPGLIDAGGRGEAFAGNDRERRRRILGRQPLGGAQRRGAGAT